MKSVAAALGILLWMAGSAGAKELEQAPPAGNWALVERISEDTPFSVRMKSGDVVQGEFIALEKDSLRLRSEGREREYPRAEIAEIRRKEIHGRKKNVLWGSIVGFGIGFPIGYFLSPLIADDDNLSSAGRFGAGAGLGGIGAGIGAGLGALAGTTREVLLFRAVGVRP